MTRPAIEQSKVTTTATSARSRSFGQDQGLSTVDRVGRWLSLRKLRAAVGPVAGRRVADVGCGYNADLAFHLFRRAEEIVLVDVAIDASLRSAPGVRVIEGHLPGSLATIESDSLDVVICNNVIEHLWEPELTLHELHRVLKPGGTCVLNVPTWRGKTFLELAAFRLHIAPATEMDDHKTYYDPRDLWPLLVAAGFTPSRITCRRHKFGLNTFAVCRK